MSIFKHNNPFKDLKSLKRPSKKSSKPVKEDEQVKISTEPSLKKDKPISKDTPMTLEELENCSEFCIKICYRETRTHIDELPLYLNELKDIVTDRLISSECVPLTYEEFDLFFYDISGDKCFLETDDDLRSAYRLLKYCNPKCLKVVVNIRWRGRVKGKRINKKNNTEIYLQRYHELFSKKREDSSSSDEENQFERLDEVFKLYKPEETKQMIIREGLTYQCERRMGNGVCTYTCEEFYTYRCTGRWKVNTLALGGEYGQLALKHSLPYCEHACIRDKESIKKFARATTSYIGGESMQFTRDEVKSVTKALIKKDPNMTPAQILTHIKSVVPNAEMPTRKEIGSIISTERELLIPSMGGAGMFDLNKIMTLRKTPFARGMAFTMVDSKPRHFLFLHSDFQEQIVKEVAKQPHPHIFIDGTFKCCPRQWHQLLNVAVYHREKKLYIPIAHILMQTKKYEGYQVALKWIKEKIPIKPEFITTDFETSLMDAIKNVFPSVDIVPCFFHFAKSLWVNAGICGLRKKYYLKDTKQLIFSLKALAFRPPETVYKRFELLKLKYGSKNNSFTRYFEYFEHTWMDNVFKIKDWNYFDKLNRFEELAITNNGLESFHQMIKSQLRRITPSFTGFIEVIARVETLRKCDYDEDRQSGDPQYNRCWPATKIMNELYCKEVTERKAKKDQKIEEPSKEDEEDFPNYVEYQGNPKDSSEKNKREYAKFEREVNLLFEEFEEENNSFMRDSLKRKADKEVLDLKSEQNKENLILDSRVESKAEIYESFISANRPSLLEKIELAKKMKIEQNPNQETDHKILHNKEFKKDIDRILAKDIEKKARKRQKIERNTVW
ncbi:unnamed protein product [Moneuplotes crassus]|uniref:MULE transposase domain-containing protein n=1 Tax=Euplotes crassus TaxID=5936 RepID=A0AAD2DAI3_EUPCR|nr:unnamed protein product [Moneuplotes crassus]